MGFESKVLKSGTILPVSDIKGKAYLTVAWRIVWFREEHPKGQILTEIIKYEDNVAIIKATIMADGQVLGIAHKKQTPKDFANFFEKAETGAIGRALAHCGYGTQFEPEFDEGDQLADAPIAPPVKAKSVSCYRCGNPLTLEKNDYICTMEQPSHLIFHKELLSAYLNKHKDKLNGYLQT